MLGASILSIQPTHKPPVFYGSCPCSVMETMETDPDFQNCELRYIFALFQPIYFVTVMADLHTWYDSICAFP